MTVAYLTGDFSTVPLAGGRRLPVCALCAVLVDIFLIGLESGRHCMYGNGITWLIKLCKDHYFFYLVFVRKALNADITTEAEVISIRASYRVDVPHHQ